MFGITNIKMIIAGVVVAAIALTIGTLMYQKSKLVKEVAQLQKEITLQEQANKHLTNSIDAQNKSIDNLVLEAERKAKASNEELKRAQDKSQAIKESATQVLISKPATNDMCESALILINSKVIK